MSVLERKRLKIRGEMVEIRNGKREPRNKNQEAMKV
jgi:hypothetical protein